jgi:hypothetical protein
MIAELRRPYQHDNVVTLAVASIIPEPEGGWLVVTHSGHGWLHGSRQAALDEKHWLDDQLGGQR